MIRLSGDFTGTGGLGRALSLAGRGGASGLIVSLGDFRSCRGDVCDVDIEPPWDCDDKGALLVLGLLPVSAVDGRLEGALAVESLILRLPSISTVPVES